MKEVLSFLRDDLAINPKQTLIIAVSGGSDSMALLSLLLTTSYHLVVVHFNHQKRPESRDEAKLVESFCQEHDVPFHYYALNIAGGNFHHRAHHLRTHYLNEVAHVYKTPYVLTAHHLDDLLENILIKLTRGSNLLGYAGMQRVHRFDDMIYVKPMLYVSKADIMAYVRAHQVPYLDDASNDEHAYLRNRYRHAVVPIMRQENETLLEQIKQYHLQVSAAFQAIRSHTKRFLNNGEVIDVVAFQNLEEAYKDDVIAYLIELKSLSLTYRTVQKIKAILQGKRPNTSYPLSNRHTFVRAYQEAYIQHSEPVEHKRVELKEGKTKVGNVSIFTFFDKTDAKETELVKLCYNKLAFPLWIRHREDGDMLRYSYGHKKLKKLLIDLKIPAEARKRLWVVTDNDDLILWIPDYYVNETLGDEHELYFHLTEEKKHAQ
ncbi:MAG: tRNA lysidine(34) synthetase TilS [Acholeplasmataceae bacterium]|nr:MAG: tRNA lysidine(34) synthetase TilS [Acholeplasmataceae bacterium]